MPGDPALVSGRRLDELVREIIVEVLVVSPDRVRPGVALIRDLGAESIDFMDLVFRLEDSLEIRIPYTRWQQFLNSRFAGADFSATLTPELVLAFAEEVMARA